MPGPLRFLVEAPVFQRGARGRRRIGIEQDLAPGQVQLRDKLGGRVDPHCAIEMMLPAPGGGLGSGQLREIDTGLEVTGRDSDAESVSMTQGKQQRGVEGSGRKRARFDQSGVCAALFGLQLEVGDIPARRRKRQDQRDSAVDEDLGAFDCQRGAEKPPDRWFVVDDGDEWFGCHGVARSRPLVLTSGGWPAWGSKTRIDAPPPSRLRATMVP